MLNVTSYSVLSSIICYLSYISDYLDDYLDIGDSFAKGLPLSGLSGPSGRYVRSVSSLCMSGL